MIKRAFLCLWEPPSRSAEITLLSTSDAHADPDLSFIAHSDLPAASGTALPGRRQLAAHPAPKP